jgi:hypothetical protein
MHWAQLNPLNNRQLTSLMADWAIFKGPENNDAETVIGVDGKDPEIGRIVV